MVDKLLSACPAEGGSEEMARSLAVFSFLDTPAVLEQGLVSNRANVES